MNTTMIRLLLVAGIATGLAACQQQRNNDATGAAVRDVPAAAVSSATTAEPASVPPNDPSLPPYGTAPASPASAPSAGATDSTHSTLSASERDRALPLEGQVNNHSSEAFAKRGDSNVEHAQEGPRGSEAVATPNSYPKEQK